MCQYIRAAIFSYRVPRHFSLCLSLFPVPLADEFYYLLFARSVTLLIDPLNALNNAGMNIIIIKFSQKYFGLFLH